MYPRHGGQREVEIIQLDPDSRCYIPDVTLAMEDDEKQRPFTQFQTEGVTFLM